MSDIGNYDNQLANLSKVGGNRARWRAGGCSPRGVEEEANLAYGNDLIWGSGQVVAVIRTRTRTSIPVRA
jgi:hypothetical protein